MNQELQEKIFALKPEWFKGLSHGIECGDGWFNLIEELTQKLTALMTESPDDFKVFQIKSKLGGLRYYVSGTDSTRARVLIDGYEYKSYSVCEVCGKDAKVRTLEPVMTLCRYPHE